MRTYVVKAGDSPGSIAANFAGCPKCARDLPIANPSKPTITYPNGFTTFRTLDVGEVLNLPDKWFSKEFDELPPVYFQALPYADGVTPSTLGDRAAGVLGDYALLDSATAKVNALAAMDIASFSSAVGEAGSSIDAAVEEAYGSPNAQAAQYAQAVQSGTQWAWQRNQDLTAALTPGAPIDAAATTQARLDIQNALSTALGNAKLTLQSLYSNQAPSAPSTPIVDSSGFPPALVSAAQAVTTAIAADPNYCSSVAQSGSAVNAAVHAFKSVWNGSQTPSVPINTGNYETATANAIMQVFGSAPIACSGGAPLPAPYRPPPASPSAPVAAAQGQGLSTGQVVGIGLLAAGMVGGVAYAATRKRRVGGVRR
jgi:hypothetical protein